MKLIFMLISLTFISASSCASAEPVKSRDVLKDFVIVWRSVIPPFTGYTKTWIELVIESPSAKTTVFYPNLEDGRQIPEVGQVCAATYHIELIDGQAGNRDVRVRDAMVIDSIECEPAKGL